MKTTSKSKPTFLPRFHRLAWLAVLGSGLVGCATAPPSKPTPPDTPVAEYGVSAQAVARSSPLEQQGLSDNLLDVDMLALSPEMLAFIDEHIDREGGESERLAQLLYAVLSGDRFKLEYDDTTGTAISTFEHRGGNCISFTNMFIAMARNLDLDARYQEVEIPADWTVSGNTWLISEHINVLVDVKNALSRVVDFNSYDTIVDVESQSRVVSDSRARAHYFNNIGVERMLADEVGLAYANLQHSIEQDPTFASSWVNMGILHRREGFEDYAEAAYLEALRLDRDNLMAMSNLADLYQNQGREEEAKRYLSRVREHRMGNPFYRFRLADIAFNDGDYKAAIKNLKYAIRQKNDEDQFYYLLSLSYLMAGDKEEAQRWMKEAQEVARATKDKKRYSRKLELLMGKDAS